MKTKNMAAIALFFVICVVFFWLGRGELNYMADQEKVPLYWVAIVPPLLAIFMTFITSKLRTSLILSLIHI